MKKIISFSLYGEDLKYWVGALENIKLAQEFYPEWKCRFYIDADANPGLMNMVCQMDCEIILETPVQTHSGLFWRFYAADDADIMICRDTDSRLSDREAKAVYDWLDTGRCFHIMRDHPYHTALIPGGMWGCRDMEGIRTLIEKFPLQNAKGTDQLFLARVIYPQIKDNAIIHDSYNLFNDGIDFPIPRLGKEFIGAAYDQFGNLQV